MNARNTLIVGVLALSVISAAQADGRRSVPVRISQNRSVHRNDIRSDRGGEEQSYGSEESGQYITPGGGFQWEDPAITWCNNVVRELERAEQLAGFAFRQGNFGKAASILQSAISDAAHNPYGNQGPLLARALIRGEQLSQVIRQSVGNAPNAPRTVIYFLSKYIGFVKEVAMNLDVNYYIPYTRCRDCGMGNPFDDEEFERRLLEYSRSEVQVILDSMTVSGGDTGYPVVPVGSTASFVNLLSRSAQYSSNDLRESVFAPRYGCVIHYLSELSQMLDAGGLGNAPDTVNYAYQEASSLVDEIKPGVGCFNYDPYHDGHGGGRRGHRHNQDGNGSNDDQDSNGSNDDQQDGNGRQ